MASYLEPGRNMQLTWASNVIFTAISAVFLASCQASNGGSELSKTGRPNQSDQLVSSQGGTIKELQETKDAKAFIDRLVEFSKAGKRENIPRFDLASLELHLGVRLVELPLNVYSSQRRFVVEGEKFSANTHRESAFFTLERRDTKDTSLRAVYKVSIDANRDCINFDFLVSHTKSDFFRMSNTPIPSSSEKSSLPGSSRGLVSPGKGGVFGIGKGFFLIAHVADDGCIQQIEAFSSFDG